MQEKGCTLWVQPSVNKRHTKRGGIRLRVVSLVTRYLGKVGDYLW